MLDLACGVRFAQSVPNRVSEPNAKNLICHLGENLSYAAEVTYRKYPEWLYAAEVQANLHLTVFLIQSKTQSLFEAL